MMSISLLKPSVWNSKLGLESLNCELDSTSEVLALIKDHKSLVNVEGQSNIPR